jgi:hypothetical protein
VHGDCVGVGELVAEVLGVKEGVSEDVPVAVGVTVPDAVGLVVREIVELVVGLVLGLVVAEGVTDSVVGAEGEIVGETVGEGVAAAGLPIDMQSVSTRIKPPIFVRERRTNWATASGTGGPPAANTSIPATGGLSKFTHVPETVG